MSYKWVDRPDIPAEEVYTLEDHPTMLASISRDSTASPEHQWYWTVWCAISLNMIEDGYSESLEGAKQQCNKILSED